MDTNTALDIAADRYNAWPHEFDTAEQIADYFTADNMATMGHDPVDDTELDAMRSAIEIAWRVLHATEGQDVADAERDEALEAAVSAGMSLRGVAQLAGLSHTRVRQIVTAERTTMIRRPRAAEVTYHIRGDHGAGRQLTVTASAERMDDEIDERDDLDASKPWATILSGSETFLGAGGAILNENPVTLDPYGDWVNDMRDKPADPTELRKVAEEALAEWIDARDAV